MTSDQQGTVKKAQEGAAAARYQLSTLADEIRIAQAQIVALQRDNARARGDAAAARAEVARLRGQVRGLQNSSSWRITRPLRAVRRATIGRGRI